MMNLIIGLCFGVAAAVALVLMWRMAEHLRKELQSGENSPEQQEAPRRGEVLKDLAGDK